MDSKVSYKVTKPYSEVLKKADTTWRHLETLQIYLMSNLSLRYADLIFAQSFHNL